MDICVNGIDSQNSNTRSSTNPQSLFKKPDIYCRFSACLHTLGAISILIGCLLVRTYTSFGIIFLSLGFCLTVVGVVLILIAVSLIMRTSRNRKYRDLNRNFCADYRSAHNSRELKLELVSNYFTPIIKSRSNSLMPRDVTHPSNESVANHTVDPLAKSPRKSLIVLKLNDKQLVNPELTVELPALEVNGYLSATPGRRRPVLSPSKCPSDPLSIPFYPPRSPSMDKTSKSLRCSPESPTGGHQRSRSVSPQRHRPFIY